jgi:hypothetical protein
VTPAKQEERVFELTQEDDDEAVDELAGDEGEPWHPSASPCAHPRYASPSISTDPRGDGDGPSVKDS